MLTICDKFFTTFVIIYFASLSMHTNSAIANDNKDTDVPVFMWSTDKITEHFNYLLPSDSLVFRDVLQCHITNEYYLVMFIEKHLSRQDFPLYRQYFPNMSNLKYTAYTPYTTKPKNVLMELASASAPHIFIEDNFDLDIIQNTIDDKILVIDLDDKQPNETKADMFKRHDELIINVYNSSVMKYGKFFGMYTSYKTTEEHQVLKRATVDEVSLSSDLISDKQLKMDANGKVFVTPNALLYINGIGVYSNGKDSVDINDFTATSEDHTDIVQLTLSGSKLVISFTFDFVPSGYWYLTKINVNHAGSTSELMTKEPVSAPNGFSYRCYKILARDVAKKNETLLIPGIQIQPFQGNMSDQSESNVKSRRFGDPYDCVGFMSIPLLSGLFATFILLAILTFGLHMITNINTMDRFDDSKGKTITINTSD